MITSVFFNLIFSAVSFLVNKLPDVSMNSNFTVAISTASTYITAIYNLFPYIITAVLAIIAFDLLFEGAYLLFKVIYWVIRRFPTQS
jgi:hypothetical protein